ncbi:MAG: hypothetical protein B6U65_02070 [Candidatus Wolframiiraptor sp. EX4484-121]|nr:MAG: hypothetical protein B6U65_02070 [Candidatus Wolframiiraptor sp. EX4484-121]
MIFKCPRCGGSMRREKFVLDTWLDSGMAHTASIDGLRNRELFKKLFPYDFITEAIDQTRGWFYTLLFTSTLLYGQPPYKTVLNQGHVMDAEGKKMSKSKGNVIWAIDMMKKYGADPLRLYLSIKAAPWENMNFVESEVGQVIQDLNILWNVFSFAETYFKLDRFDPERITVESIWRHLRPEDRWIISKVNSLTRFVTSSLKSLNIHSAVRALRSFILDDLSRLYVRAVRRRVWIEEETWDKLAVYATLYYVLKRLTLILAPIIPHLAEKLFQALRLRDDPESVHLARWPRVDERFVDEELEDEMEIARSTISEILHLRQRHGRKLRWPVKSIILSPLSPRAKKALESLRDFIRSQVNALELRILDVGERPEGMSLIVKPVYERLGPKLGKDLAEVVERLKQVDGEVVQRELSSSGSFKLMLSGGKVVELIEGDMAFEERLPENLAGEKGRFTEIYLDLTETKEIVAQSLAKEVIRRVQIMRKEMDLMVSDYIDSEIILEDEERAKLLEMMREFIKEETRSKQLKIVVGRGEAEGYAKDWMIEGEKVRIVLRKA